MPDLETICSYLVGLGFSVDQGAYNKFKQALADTSKDIERHSSGWVKSYASAALSITTAITSITIATAGMLEKIAQADLGYKKYALRMYMGADAAKKMKIATDALGESLDDIAWIPELRGRYSELMKQQQAMMPGKGFESQMKYLRDIRFEFTRLKVEMTYGSQWIGQYLLKYLNSPIGNFYGWMQKLNDYLTAKMPVWTEKVARFLTVIINLGGSAYRVLSDIGGKVKELWDRLPAKVKKKGLLVALFGFAFLPGPLRALRILGTLIILVDDFYAYIDGRKSSKTLAPIWDMLLGQIRLIKQGLEGIIEAFALVKKGDFGGAWQSLKNAKDVLSDMSETLDAGTKKEDEYVAEQRKIFIIKNWSAWNDERSKQTGTKYFMANEPNTQELSSRHPDEIKAEEDRARAEYRTRHARYEQETEAHKLQFRKSDSGLDGIRSQESGGNYNAVNPDSGARGAYQIMPKNWPSWSMEAGLPSNAPMTKENQDRVARYKWGQYLEQFGDVRLAAAAWYAGPRYAQLLKAGRISRKAFERKQGGKYPSVSDYIKQSTGKNWDLTSRNYQDQYKAGSLSGPSSNSVVIHQHNTVQIKVDGEHSNADEIARKVKKKLDAASDLAAARSVRDFSSVMV